MDKIYTVSYQRYNGEYRMTDNGVARVYRNLEDAFKYIQEFTGLDREAIEANWSEGFADILGYDTLYIIEEHVLE